MNAFKINKNTKTGRSGDSVHHSPMDGTSHMQGISPTSTGPLGSFYTSGPVLSLKGLIQPKLTIGQPNDRYEQEADRVADQVMRMPEPGGALINGHWSLGKSEKGNSLVNGHLSLVQRQSICPECPESEEVQRQEEEEEEEEPVG